LRHGELQRGMNALNTQNGGGSELWLSSKLWTSVR